MERQLSKEPNLRLFKAFNAATTMVTIDGNLESVEETSNNDTTMGIVVVVVQQKLKQSDQEKTFEPASGYDDGIVQ